MIVQVYETQNCEEAKKLVEVGVDHIGVLVGNGIPGNLVLNKQRKFCGA
jgi:hypothetical protein